MNNAQLNMEKMMRQIDALSAKSDALEKLYGAQLIWRIENYKQQWNEAKSGTRTMVFSPPFMSGRHGYKLMLSVALFGDGPGTRYR